MSDRPWWKPGGSHGSWRPNQVEVEVERVVLVPFTYGRITTVRATTVKVKEKQ